MEATSEAFIARRFGEPGRAWLASVPATVALLAERWALEVGEPLRGGLLSSVFAARRHGTEQVVLKVAGPWSPTREEAEALHVWGGVRTPALLEADDALGALLLERIQPGDAAPPPGAREAADLLRALHVPPPPGLRALADVARERLAIAAAEGRARHKVDWALARIEELEQEAPPAVLLHGDLGGRNLLSCRRRGLAAIDPLPCAGDPAYDAGTWAQAEGRPGRRARTTEIAEAMGLPLERVRGWCAVVAVHG